MATAVNNGHGLQTHALHVDLGCEQEAVVKVIEELVPSTTRSLVETVAVTMHI